VLTYCTNIHPAESWAETFANVRRYVPEVKGKISPVASFPIGLRLSGRAAGEIDRGERERFYDWCTGEDCFVATVNGFPFGTFHHVPIKEAVYLPDWRHPERLHYTRQLADLLSFWLPEGTRGSISTVPLGFKENIGPDEGRLAAHNIRQALEFLDRLAQKTGKEIVLAIEPEPSCALETTPDVVRFFAQLNLPASLRPFLAVCYDCCHQALQFETPAHSLKLLADNNIRIGHVQVSSALRLEHPDIGRLQRFREPCYLHQTVGWRRDGSLLRFPDLDPALAADRDDVAEWRVHFHVPVFVDRLADCASTQPFLRDILPLFDPAIPLEVETYTWTVLPPDLQTTTVTESIVREIEWVKEELKAGAPSGTECRPQRTARRKRTTR
jgi:hypothetical protein